MKPKMRKILQTVAVFLMGILCVGQTFAYQTQVTKTNLTKAFETFAKGYTGGYVTNDGFGLITIEPSKPIRVTNTELIDEREEENTYHIDYSLNANPTFSIETNINHETKLSEICDLDKLLKEPVLGLLGVGLVQGLPIGNAYNYYQETLEEIQPYNIENYRMASSKDELTIWVENQMFNFKQEDFDVSELVNLLFATEEKVFRDEKYGVYTYNLTVTQNSEDDYTIKANLVIQQDADFSKIAQLEGTENTEDKDNNVDNDTNIDNDNSNNPPTQVPSTTPQDTTQNQDETLAKTELPKTGASLKVGLTILFMIGLVILFKMKLEKYKDIK